MLSKGLLVDALWPRKTQTYFFKTYLHDTFFEPIREEEFYVMRNLEKKKFS